MFQVVGLISKRKDVQMAFLVALIASMSYKGISNMQDQRKIMGTMNCLKKNVKVALELKPLAFLMQTILSESSLTKVDIEITKTKILYHVAIKSEGSINWASTPLDSPKISFAAIK